MVGEQCSLFTTEKTNRMDAKELRDKLERCFVTPAGLLGRSTTFGAKKMKLLEYVRYFLLIYLSFVDISCRYFCPLCNIMSTSFIVPKAANTER